MTFSPRKILDFRIYYYKRHKDYNPKLVEKVLKQADEFGLEYVVSNVSDESKELFKKSRGPMGECHQATAFLRFEECGELLVSKTEFEHDIADNVLKHFMSRFPQRKVVIVTGGKAYVGENGIIKIESPDDYPEAARKVKIQQDEDWLTFYNSQYIEARRNRKLAMKGVPKKYWKKFGIVEGEMIDKGIPTNTLSDFI